jgi:hypothetical protein
MVWFGHISHLSGRAGGVRSSLPANMLASIEGRGEDRYLYNNSTQLECLSEFEATFDVETALKCKLPYFTI